ncbi:hypothetical protein ACOSP7_020966 [Xanthoceras sorbifolium]
MHSSRAGLSLVRGPIRSTSDRFTEQGVKQGLIGEPGRSQCCVQLCGLAGWKGLLSAVCLSLLSLLLAKSNFWLTISWAQGLQSAASPVVVSSFLTNHHTIGRLRSIVDEGIDIREWGRIVTGLRFTRKLAMTL